MDPFVVAVNALVYEDAAGKALFPDVLTPDEIRLLLSTVRNRTLSRKRGRGGALMPDREPRSRIRPRDHLLLSLAYRYGLTGEELGRLLVRDVDLVEETIRIRRMNDTVRTYPLFLDLVPLCVEWEQDRWLPRWCGPDRLAVAAPPADQDYLFFHAQVQMTDSGPRLRPMTVQNIGAILADTQQIAGLDRPAKFVTSGAIRRAIGAHLVAAGWTPAAVAAHLGLPSAYSPSLEEYRERLRALATSRWLAPVS